MAELGADTQKQLCQAARCCAKHPRATTRVGKPWTGDPRGLSHLRGPAPLPVAVTGAVKRDSTSSQQVGIGPKTAETESNTAACPCSMLRRLTAQMGALSTYHQNNEVCYRREEILPRARFHYRGFWGRNKKVLQKMHEHVLQAGRNYSPYLHSDFTPVWELRLHWSSPFPGGNGIRLPACGRPPPLLGEGRRGGDDRLRGCCRPTASC